MPNSPAQIAEQNPNKLGFGTRKCMPLAYGLTFALIPCTIFFLLNNPSHSQSPSIVFTNILKTRSQFSTVFSRFFPNSTRSSSHHDSLRKSQVFRFPFSPKSEGFSQKKNSSSKGKTKSSENQATGLNGPAKEASENSHVILSGENDGVSGKMSSSSNVSNQPSSSAHKTIISENQGLDSNGPIHGYSEKSSSNETLSSQSPESASKKGSVDKNVMGNSASESVKGATTKGVEETKMIPKSTALSNKQTDGTNGVSTTEQSTENWVDLFSHCDIFDGSWVRDDSYPLYAAGSCPHLDEPFNCFRNGRGDNGYEKFRWKPKGCYIPRLNGRDFLELLRGKRLVYVGDSLNRNMWESMVCALRNSVEDKNKVFEASGREELQTENSYSFLFTDYNCSVEFFRSTFLVREWEMPVNDGSKKETLRLDLVERSSDRYKTADFLVFNTGHWWTHEKTAQGKGYYQEGSHVYGELDVAEAFRKAMTTWARWIDAKINPAKTLVVFRGYSASHFSGGQWNSGGQCDNETEPIKNEAYLSKSLPIMSMLERVLKGMKTPVFYLNVTKMTDFRKDAHPSIYRKQYLTEEERQSPLRYQDCSHWCLPGVPDTWNELLYALIKYNQKQRQ